MSCAPGGIGPERRPAQHELSRRLALAGEGRRGERRVGQIGLAAAELRAPTAALGARQMRAQIGFEPGRIEPLVRPLVDQLGGFEAGR